MELATFLSGPGGAMVRVAGGMATAADAGMRVTLLSTRARSDLS